MKSNPLFHDSTVSQGSNVQTKFELSGVHLNEAQVLCLKLIVGGEVRFIEMQEASTETYVTSAWIEHRKRISYQYFIQMDGELVASSDLKSSLALHTLADEWAPSQDPNWRKSFAKVPDQVERVDLDFVEASKEEESEGYLDNLIDKWDL